ncbi:MAG TPA: NAD(P)/FAD-dependent oxidoreductase [Opitutaceae bacterium]|jgi:protoporphyrinogen oxidase|nr:NAD(P)/FAD-dependent oxidoreductase [Opitutaceae bacterium]
MNKTTQVAIIGAGPAGLTAAYLLAKRQVQVTVIEADSVYVGGIARTVCYKNYYFDIGGHRFFSKSKAVEDFWREILPDDFLVRPRKSRIYYAGKFFSYPLKPFEALLKLGLFESIRCMLSWLKARISPVRNPRNFQDWVSNQFGRRLFGIFFKSYTEKVWGMDCREISADWAAQRIKGVSLGAMLKNAFAFPSRKKSRVVKSLISSFNYPRRGPGMMWEACANKMQAQGGKLYLGRAVVGCAYDAQAKIWRLTLRDAQGGEEILQADEVISSAPLRELAEGITPGLPPAVRQSAGKLRYRDFLIVALILPDRHVLSDNWIYIHDPSVKVGRVQNFKSWSPEMVPDPAMCCYGLEYFCFEGDGLWTASDESLIALAKKELEQIGLARAAEVTDGCVVRQKKAYPVYDDEYALHVDRLRQEFEKNYPTLHLVGRNGMHKYNNQDHAMMTAMLCTENILAGRRIYDLWRVNQDAEYHEAGEAASESGAGGLRLVPQRVAPPAPDPK